MWVVLIVDAVGNVREWTRRESFREVESLLDSLPRNGWSFFSLLYWNGEVWIG